MTHTLAQIIWALGVVLWIAIRVPRRRKARKTKTIADRKSTMERIALGLCILGLVILPTIQIATNVFDPFDFGFYSLMGILGAASMLAFLTLFHLSHKHLAANWSVTLEIRKDHKLVDTGIYRYIRHPMYTSFWLWGLAQALLLQNWAAGFAGLMSVAILYFSRIEEEEAMMEEAFGDDYRDYRKTTGRLLPRLNP